MNYTQKTLFAAAAVGLVLLLLFGTMGSLAVFSSKQTSTNTIVMGNLSLELSETEWNGPAQLKPGTEIAKNPTLTVGEGSANCYVFATVDMRKPELFKTAGVTLQYQDEKGSWKDGIAPEWELLQTTELPGGGMRSVYAYHEIVPHSLTQKGALPLKLFGRIEIPDSASGIDCSNAAANTITVKGWAIQAEGFENNKSAWSALLEKTT